MFAPLLPGQRIGDMTSGARTSRSQTSVSPVCSELSFNALQAENVSFSDRLLELHSSLHHLDEGECKDIPYLTICVQEPYRSSIDSIRGSSGATRTTSALTVANLDEAIVASTV